MLNREGHQTISESIWMVRMYDMTFSEPQFVRKGLENLFCWNQGLCSWRLCLKIVPCCWRIQISPFRSIHSADVVRSDDRRTNIVCSMWRNFAEDEALGAPKNRALLCRTHYFVQESLHNLCKTDRLQNALCILANRLLAQLRLQKSNNITAVKGKRWTRPPHFCAFSRNQKTVKKFLFCFYNSQRSSATPCFAVGLFQMLLHYEL